MNYSCCEQRVLVKFFDFDRIVLLDVSGHQTVHMISNNCQWTDGVCLICLAE